jgi:hypothetical protein
MVSWWQAVVMHGSPSTVRYAMRFAALCPDHSGFKLHRVVPGRAPPELIGYGPRPTLLEPMLQYYSQDSFG